MNPIWLPLAIVSYVMQAINGAVDRIIVNNNVTTSAVVSFWVAVFSVFTIFILAIGYLPLPFAEQFRFETPTPRIFWLATLAGFLSQLGLYYMYRALEDGEATRVLTVLGAITPLATFGFAYSLLGERINGLQGMAFAVLVSGAIVLTYNQGTISAVKSSRWIKNIVLASVLLALQSVVIKIVFNEYHFISGFALTSVGALIYALLLIAVAPSVRYELWGKKRHKSEQPDEEKVHVGWIIGNSALGGIAIIILNLAIDLGSPTFINALRGVQYAGVFVIALLLAKKYPKLLDEELTRATITQKIAGILLIINGVTLLAIAS